jgi:hypothetical protein
MIRTATKIDANCGSPIVGRMRSEYRLIVWLRIWDLELGIWDLGFGIFAKRLARPAGLEPATSWFVAANVGRNTFDFIGVSMLCHAGLPCGQGEDVAFNYG